jgi:hypothetical protein
MESNCELLEKCGFFNKYKANSGVIRQGWIRMYCQSHEKSDKCKRKQIRRETGTPPPDNMAPTGDMMTVATAE